MLPQNQQGHGEGVATRASGAWMLAPSSEIGICRLWEQCCGVWPGTTQCAVRVPARCCAEWAEDEDSSYAPQHALI